MKRKERLLLAGLMCGLLFLLGCGEPVVEEEVVEEPPVVYVYSTNDEISQKFEYVWDKNEDLKERVEFITLPEEGYVAAIEALLTNPETEKYPDVVVADYEDITHFTNAEYTLPLPEMGFVDKDFEQMYDYTKAVVSNDKEDVMGVTWKVNPGAFIYRKSLAMEYLGYDDEDNVQSFVKDWDTLIDTARTISKKSNGAVKLLSSADVLDKQFEPGIANTYTAEANDINVSSQGTVFGYFCDLDVISKLEKVNKGTSNGDWAICQGPEGFVNGGSWMFVTDKCPDKELAGDVIKKLCTDSNVMAKMAENDREFVNNKKVMSNAYNTNKGKLELLGGGDYIKVFDKVATKAILEKPEDIVVEQEIEAETEGEAEQE